MDLGREKEYKIVLKLALPAMLGQFINVLYSIIDRMYISGIGGSEYPLTGVGVIAPICTLIISFSYLIGIGGAPLMAMSLGEKNESNAKKILANAFILLAAIGIIIPIILLSCYKPLLYTFGATANTYSYAEAYLLIYLIGVPFSILSTGLNQYLIAEGYSTKGMITMAIGAIINIILDPIFIFTFNMGVSGAALATIISQMCSFLYVFLILLFGKCKIKLSFKNYDISLMKRILRLGLSPFIIQMTDSLMVLALNMSISLNAGELVDEYILVGTITTSFYQLFSMPLLGISGGTQPVLSYNYGARNSKRVKLSEKYILLLAFIFNIICIGLSYLLADPFISLFTNNDTVHLLTNHAIKIYMYSFLILIFQYCYVDGLTGLGKARIAITLSLIRKSLALVLVFVFPLIMGMNGCFISQMTSDIISSIISFIVFNCLINKILNQRENSSTSVLAN